MLFQICWQAEDVLCICQQWVKVCLKPDLDVDQEEVEQGWTGVLGPQVGNIPYQNCSINSKKQLDTRHMEQCRNLFKSIASWYLGKDISIEAILTVIKIMSLFHYIKEFLYDSCILVLLLVQFQCARCHVKCCVMFYDTLYFFELN